MNWELEGKFKREEIISQFLFQCFYVFLNKYISILYTYSFKLPLYNNRSIVVFGLMIILFFFSVIVMHHNYSIPVKYNIVIKYLRNFRFEVLGIFS